MTYALITGASKGIGKAIAYELATRKHNLLLVARTETLLKELAYNIQATHNVEVAYLALNLAEPEAANTIFEFCQKQNIAINILVNNAGFGYGGLFANNSLSDNLSIIDLNISSLTRLTQVMLPLLEQNTPAHIVNIASTAAYQAVPNLAIYAASKAYVLSFSRALAHELQPKNISVTAVSPGGTNTEFANVARLKAKAQKAGEKLNMTAESVAKIAINAMYARKAEVVTGFANKLGVFGAWLLPKKLIEKIAGSIYE
jgi:uncharacterized protein